MARIVALYCALMLTAVSSGCRTTNAETSVKDDGRPPEPEGDHEPTIDEAELEGLIPETLDVDLAVVRKLGDYYSSGFDRYPIQLRVWKRLPKVATVPAAEWKERVARAFSLGYVDDDPPDPLPSISLDQLVKRELSTYHSGKSDGELKRDREALQSQLAKEEIDQADFDYLNGRVGLQLLLNQVVVELRSRFGGAETGVSSMYPIFAPGHAFIAEDDCSDRFDCDHIRKRAYVFANPEYVVLLVVVQTNG